MIAVRSLYPVDIAGERDTVIARFADSAWWHLIELTRQYGFNPPHVQIYLSPPYDHPVQIDVETSQKLWEAISAVYNDDHAILHTVPELHGWVQVRQLMDCA